MILKDRYSKTPPTVDGYEVADNSTIEGEISEDKTVQVLYYLLLQDDTTLVFTGLNSKGKETSNESEIIEYMIGDGSNNRPNAFIDSTNAGIKSILNVPEVYNGKPVTKIGKNAFGMLGTVWIMKINFTENITTIDTDAFLYCRQLGEVTIEKNVTSIGHEAFMGCQNLKKIILKNSMQSYPNISFGGCTSWNEIEIGSDNISYTFEDNTLYSKDKKNLILCLRKDSGEYIVPQSVETISNLAFYYSNVESIILNDNIKTLKDNVFRGTKIKNIVIPEKITNIPNLAFYQCPNLETIQIGSGVETIGNNNTFGGGTKIKTIIMDSPKIAKNITDQNSFAGLVKYMETIYIKDGITEIGSYITENFSTATSDKQGYTKYVKK